MGDDSKKAHFAGMPLRAVSDGRLTDRDFRNLAVVAGHDHMSLVRGRGQGAWASHKTMAAEVGGDGADYSRFSTSMNKLVSLGYLQRDRLNGDARRHTYRVIYTDEDRLQQRKQSGGPNVCARANERDGDGLPSCDNDLKIVCRADDLSGGKNGEICSQYISLSEGIDSAEAGKEDSAEAARFAARELLQVDHKLPGGANLAILARALKANVPIDLVGWYAYLGRLPDFDGLNPNHVFRISEMLADQMTPAQLEAAYDRIRS